MTDEGRTLLDRLKVLGVALLTATLLLGAVAVAPSIDQPSSPFVSGEVTVAEGTVYLDRTGQPTAVAAVDNDRRTAMTNAEATVHFYEGETHVGSVEGSFAAETVAAGAFVPFSARLPDSDAEPDRFEVDLSYDDVETSPPNLEAGESTVSDRSSHEVTIDGSVVNHETDPVDAAVLVTFLDEEENVLGYRHTTVSPSPIDAGDSAEYRVRYATLGDVPSLAGEYDSHRVAVVEA